MKSAELMSKAVNALSLPTAKRRNTPPRRHAFRHHAIVESLESRMLMDATPLSYEWIGDESSDFFTAGNWKKAGTIHDVATIAPVNSNAYVFDLTISSSVTPLVNANNNTIRSLTITGDMTHPGLNLAGNTLNVGTLSLTGTKDVFTPQNGIFSTGLVNITGSAAGVTNANFLTLSGGITFKVSESLKIGQSENAYGSLTVDTGAKIDAPNANAIIGANGAGLLGSGMISIRTGGNVTLNSLVVGGAVAGTVNVSGSQDNLPSTLTLKGAKANALDVGGGKSNGEVVVDDGGVLSAPNISLKKGTGSATVTFKDKGEWQKASGLTIDSDTGGTRQFSVGEGVDISLKTLYADGAYKSDAAATVYIAGHLKVTEETRIANNSGLNCWMNIDKSGTLTTPSLTIGHAAGASGEIEVNGHLFVKDAAEAMQAMTVGEHGNGTVTVFPGGSVECSNITLGMETGSNGTLSLDGDLNKPAPSIKVDNIYVGKDGTGLLEASVSGVIDMTTNLEVPQYNSGGHGTVDLSGIKQHLFCKSVHLS